MSTPPPSAKEAALERLMALRDEFERSASHGRFIDSASREWRQLPLNWRITLLLVAGIGMDGDHLETLALRSWREMPEPERLAVQRVVRSAKQHLARLTALCARV